MGKDGGGGGGWSYLYAYAGSTVFLETVCLSHEQQLYYIVDNQVHILYNPYKKAGTELPILLITRTLPVVIY